MDADQIKNGILELTRQREIGIYQGGSLVAVSNNSDYNIHSYPDYGDAEKHALGAGDAFWQCEPMPIIYVLATESNVKGLRKIKVVDGKLQLECIE